MVFLTARYYIRGRNCSPAGSHLLGFSRNSLKAMRHHFNAIHEYDHSHLMGLDTFLCACRSVGLVRLHARSIAYQRKHPLPKRR